MGKLIDICGTPIEAEKIKDFHVSTRDYIYCPCYEETVEQKRSIFSRWGDPEKKFQYCSMVPFGCIMGEKEKPSLGSYEIKDFGEAIGKYALESVSDAIGTIGSFAADIFRLDTSGNKMYTILTPGRRTTKIRLREIPAKVKFLSGKIADVYKNDPIYGFLGEPIAPVVAQVKVLVINIDKRELVFFGNGIDVDDPHIIYSALIEHHNELEDAKNTAKAKFALPQINVNIPKLNMPKIDFSAIKIQSPFTIEKKQPEKASDQDTE